MTEQDVTKSVIERLVREALIEIDSRAEIAKAQVDQQVQRTRSAVEAAADLAANSDLSGILQHDCVAVGETVLYERDRPYFDMRVAGRNVDLKTLLGGSDGQLVGGRFRVIVTMKRIGDVGTGF